MSAASMGEVGTGLFWFGFGGVFGWWGLGDICWVFSCLLCFLEIQNII